jgi:hypothetical protein
VNLLEIGWDGVDWIGLAQDRDKCQQSFSLDSRTLPSCGGYYSVNVVCIISVVSVRFSDRVLSVLCSPACHLIDASKAFDARCK